MSNDDKNTSDLRRLLQEKLANREAAGDGWNVPSGGVWSGVSEELSANRKQVKDARKSVWPWVAIGLLAVLLLLRECAHQRAMGKMEQEMIKLQQDCEEKMSLINQKRLENSSEAISLATGEAPVALASPTESNNGNAQPLNQSKRTETSHSIAFPNTLPTPIASAVPQLDESITSSAIAGTPTIDKSPISPITTTLAGIPTRALQPFQKGAKLIIIPLNLQIPTTKTHSIGLLGSAYAGLALTGNRLTGEKPGILSQQKALMAWRTGIGLEAVLNHHWSVLTGVDYNTSRIETKYSLAVPFTHNGEFLHDDGNYDNQYNHSLPSALGNYPLQMVLTRASDATIHEGEVMDLDLRIQQKTAFLSVPLQLRYGFGKNKWQIGIRAGAVANHVLAVESETAKLTPHHAAIHQRHTSIGAPKLAELEKWTFDYAFGLDWRYQLTNRLGLNAGTALQLAATPVYQDEAVKNYLNSVGLNLGVHYFIR